MTWQETEASAEAGEPVELFRFTRGLTTWTFTGTEHPIVYELATYEPTVIASTASDESQEDMAGAREILVARDNPVAALFVAYLPLERVAVTIVELHGDPADDPETAVVFVGEVTSCSFQGSEARLTCAPISEALRRPVPGLMFQGLCNWPLYGTGCGVQQEAHKVEAELSGVDGPVISSPAFGALPAGHLNNGWVQLPNGDVRWIVDHVGDEVTLMSAFPSLAAGVTVAAFPGCPRTWPACQQKFANDAFSGFDAMPELNPFSHRVT